MIFTNLEDFLDKMGGLIKKDPFKTRLNLKYLNTKAMVVIKVTNDKQSLMMKLSGSSDLKKMELILSDASRLMANYKDSNKGAKVDGKRKNRNARG